MDRKHYNELPDVTKRLVELIDKEAGGSVRKFALSMGLTNSSKINRLFAKDKRNGQFPIPSSDIIIMVCKSFNCSADWLLNGEEKIKEDKHINNITIGATKINGNNNITNSEDVTVENNNNEYMDIIRKQQEQINKLLELMNK